MAQTNVLTQLLKDRLLVKVTFPANTHIVVLGHFPSTSTQTSSIEINLKPTNVEFTPPLPGNMELMAWCPLIANITLIT
jgi:hypothetical protein